MFKKRKEQPEYQHTYHEPSLTEKEKEEQRKYECCEVNITNSIHNHFHQ